MPKSHPKKTHHLNSRYQQERFKLIFEYSPVAIWEEDLSAVGKLGEYLRKQKVTDVRKFLRQNKDVVISTFRKIKVLDVNRAALHLYGAKSKEELTANLGKTFNKGAIETLVDEFTTLLEGERTFEAEFKSKTLGGKFYDVLLRVSVPEGYERSLSRVIVTLQDISMRKRLERHLRKLAQVDGLTQLLNHSAIMNRLREEFTRALRYKLNLSCLMIDLDHFKVVNDKLGHQKGNSVLKDVALKIKSSLRRSDFVGRFGGDEFLAILPETSPQNAVIAASRLQKNFAQYLARVKPAIFYTLTIGISGLPSKTIKDYRMMISLADKALYQGKKNGRNTIVLA